MGSALMRSLQFSSFLLTEGLLGYSRSPTFMFPKIRYQGVPSRSLLLPISRLLLLLILLLLVVVVVAVVVVVCIVYSV